MKTISYPLLLIVVISVFVMPHFSLNAQNNSVSSNEGSQFSALGVNSENTTAVTEKVQAETELICPADIVLPVTESECGAIVFYNLPDYPADKLSIEGPQSGSMFYLGETIIKLSLENNKGIKKSCSFSVTIVDNRIPALICPPNVALKTTEGNCFINDITLDFPKVSNTCNLYSMFNNAPSVYYAGVTTVTWTVKNSNGNNTSCKQKIIVLNAGDPAIICPSDKTVYLAPGLEEIDVYDLDPIIDEDCPYILSFTMTGATNNAGTCMRTGGISGLSFRPGETTVTYIISRLGNGITSSGSFKVRVRQFLPSGSASNSMMFSNNTEKEQVNSEDVISAFPNPFSENITIEFLPEKTETICIEILNITGQKILILNSYNVIDGNPAHIELDGNLFKNSGIYFIRLRTSENEFMKRLIKL